MIKQDSCYPEERIVDIILKRVPPEQQLAFKEHCAECVICLMLAGEWREILAGYEHTSTSDWASPRERVKRQVWSELTRRATRLNRLSWLRPKPVTMMGILGIFLCLALLMLPAYFHTEEAQPMYYSVSSAVDPLVDGYVTINPATAEVYIYVQGIPTVIDRDYQAWLMEEKSTIDMGLLRLENGAGQLYKQTKEVKKARMFRISIEPKGGSVYPTGPDFLFIQLEQ